MNYGFVKVAAAVPHVKVADCKFNVEKIESLITVAEGKGVQIIIFPEMSITGYTCGTKGWALNFRVKVSSLLLTNSVAIETAFLSPKFA